MLDHSFTFNGLDMRERFGLIVSDVTDLLIPQIRERKVTVPGRSGAYDFDKRSGEETFSERQLTIRCGTSKLLKRADVRELSYILANKGRIILWNEPDKYYIGRIYSPNSIERLAHNLKQFELTFVCDPFAYGKQITQTWYSALHYPNYMGTGRTPTRISIKNVGGFPMQMVVIRVRERS